VSGGEWSKLAQAKAQRRTPVDMAINFQILFWGIPWVAEQLLGSQEWLYYISVIQNWTKPSQFVSFVAVKHRIEDGSKKRQGEEHIT
jgi:hypothetical protein